MALTISDPNIAKLDSLIKKAVPKGPKGIPFLKNMLREITLKRPQDVGSKKYLLLAGELQARKSTAEKMKGAGPKPPSVMQSLTAPAPQDGLGLDMSQPAVRNLAAQNQMATIGGKPPAGNRGGIVAFQNTGYVNLPEDNLKRILEQARAAAARGDTKFNYIEVLEKFKKAGRPLPQTQAFQKIVQAATNQRIGGIGASPFDRNLKMPGPTVKGDPTKFQPKSVGQGGEVDRQVVRDRRVDRLVLNKAEQQAKIKADKLKAKAANKAANKAYFESGKRFLPKGVIGKSLGLVNPLSTYGKVPKGAAALLAAGDAGAGEDEIVKRMQAMKNFPDLYRQQNVLNPQGGISATTPVTIPEITTPTFSFGAVPDIYEEQGFMPAAKEVFSQVGNIMDKGLAPKVTPAGNLRNFETLSKLPQPVYNAIQEARSYGMKPDQINSLLRDETGNFGGLEALQSAISEIKPQATPVYPSSIKEEILSVNQSPVGGPLANGRGLVADAPPQSDLSMPSLDSLNNQLAELGFKNDFEDLKPKEVGDYVDTVNLAMEKAGYDKNYFAEAKTKLKEMQAQTKAEGKEGRALRLFEMGLGIMAGESPNAFVNIGKGAAPAVKGLAEDIKYYQKMDRDYNKEALSLEKAFQTSNRQTGIAAINMKEKAQDRFDKAQQERKLAKLALQKTIITGKFSVKAAKERSTFGGLGLGLGSGLSGLSASNRLNIQRQVKDILIKPDQKMHVARIMGVKPEQVDEEIAMQFIQRTLGMSGSGGSSGANFSYDPKTDNLLRN